MNGYQVILLAGIMGFAPISHALIVKLSDLQSMAKKSDVVVHGYVGDKRVTTDEMGRLITLSDIEVIDGMHGKKSGDIITIYQVGGSKDGVFMPLIGGQEYHIGQEIIFFGLKTGAEYVSFGGGQGKLDIEKVNGQEIIKEDLGDVVAIDPWNRPVKPMPLVFYDKTEVKNEIRLMLQAN